MNLFDKFFQFTVWVLYAYPICGITLVILFYINKNVSSRSKIKKITGLVNIVFGIWFFLLLINNIVKAKKETGYFVYDNDPMEWVINCSSIAIIIALSFKQIRTSPFSILCISIILFIELLIMIESWKIVV